MRKFSSYGPVNKKLHFYVHREELVSAAVRELTGEDPDEGGHFITVWAPRQCGKTWIMNEALYRLQANDLFLSVKLELESLKVLSDPERIAVSLGRKIVDSLGVSCPVDGWEDFEDIFKNGILEKPLILILDEFDALDEAAISGLAGIFRNVYNTRQRDPRPSRKKEYLLHGLALVGVRSVLGVDNVKGSPFNVQRSLHIPSLGREEVQSMFQWYARESGREVDPAVVDRIFLETRGQPGLVSWLGELLTETFAPAGDHAISPEHFHAMYQRAIHSLPNNNVLNIISKAKREPYRRTVINLFRTDKKTDFSFDDPHQNFLYMNGVIDLEEDGEGISARFSSPFVQKRLFNYFSREIFQSLDHLHDPMADIDAIVGEKEVDIPALMALYRDYLARNREWLLKDAPRRKTDLRIYEAVFHFNLYMYLKNFFQDKGGEVFPEFPTGNGKVDLLIRYGTATYALELKSFRDRRAYGEALNQAAEYADRLGLDRIFLVFFIEGIDSENRRKLETPHADPAAGIQVVPLFVETENKPGYPPGSEGSGDSR